MVGRGRPFTRNNQYQEKDKNIVTDEDNFQQVINKKNILEGTSLNLTTLVKAPSWQEVARNP